MKCNSNVWVYGDSMMMNSSEYLYLVKSFFSFLENEFGMTLSSEDVRGNFFYEVQYRDSIKVVSISYENIEDYLQVVVFILEEGNFPKYDDKTKTLHVDNLIGMVMPKIDKKLLQSNHVFFWKI